MKEYWRKILKLLNPSPAIAGLELSDFYIRFFCESEGRAFFELRLTPGVIKEGKIVNIEKFKEALEKIKLKLGSNFKKISHLIVTLSSSTVYTQTFSLPYLTGDKLSEAARLNLQMISPMPVSETYDDWDLLEETEGGELKLLGAFTDKSNVDIIVKTCKEVGFIILAIEPCIQALERSVNRMLISKGELGPYLLLHVSSEGMNFVGVKKNKIYFDYFISWFSMYSGAKEIAPRVFEDTVNRYMEQVFNFAISHWNFELKEIVLVASELGDNIKNIIEKNFKIKALVQDFKDLGLSSAWGVAYGAYLRGLLPRSEDRLISLSGVGSEEEFKQSQLLLFAELWRNMVVTFGVTLLLIFVSAYLLLGRITKNSLAQNLESVSPEEQAELANLIARAETFNDLVSLIGEMRKSGRAVSPYLESLERSLGGSVAIERISFQSFSAPIIISGSAVDEKAVTSFKNRLERLREFSGVDLPLNTIVPIGGNRVSFSLKITPVPL